MARQFKQGLDYFPFDVDFFNNNKIQLIESEFGLKGVVATIRLLTKIYNNGYYYQWGEDECLLFAKEAGSEFVPNAVNEIVLGLVRRRFFDKGCFDKFGILTSQAIQEVYIEASERRKGIDLIKEYLLCQIDQNRKNVNINSINVDINPIDVDINSQSKLKESKLKESKEEIPPDVNSILAFHPLNTCKAQLLSDRSWLDIISMNFSKQFKHFQVSELDGYIDQFFDKLENEGEDSKSIKDAKQHFSNWLRIELKTSKTLQTNTNHADRSIDRSRF